MGAGTSAEEFFLKSINVESIFEFVERTDYLFLYSIKECVEKSDCHEGVYLSEVAEYMKLSIPETSKMVKSLENKGKLYVENSVDNVHNPFYKADFIRLLSCYKNGSCLTFLNLIAIFVRESPGTCQNRGNAVK